MTVSNTAIIAIVIIAILAALLMLKALRTRQQRQAALALDLERGRAGQGRPLASYGHAYAARPVPARGNVATGRLGQGMGVQRVAEEDDPEQLPSYQAALKDTVLPVSGLGAGADVVQVQLPPRTASRSGSETTLPHEYVEGGEMPPLAEAPGFEEESRGDVPGYGR